MAIQTSFATGSRGRVLVGQETVYGTIVAPTHLIDFTSESIVATENTLESQSIRGDRSKHKLIRGNKDVNGDVSFEFAASGFGIFIYNALGDYIKVEDADGGIHARIVEDSLRVINASTNGDVPDKRIVVLGDETCVEFDATKEIKVVYRDSTANDVLALGAAVTYNGFGLRDVAYVDTVATDIVANAQDYPGWVSDDAISVILTNGDGSGDDPDINPEGGVLLVGEDREEFIYFEAQQNANGTTTVWLDPSVHPAGSVPAAFVDGVAVIVKATLVKDGSSFLAGDEIAKGNFVIQHDATDYAGVVTHFLQKGEVLPVSLTVEVDRDAAIFVYSGMRVNSMAFEFPTNEILTGTATLIGKEEFAIACLEADIIPGATSITVSQASHFPSGGGTITIDERTDITYTTSTDNGDGTWTLSGIPASGDNAIDRQHLKGVNVDLRTTTAIASPIQSDLTPLTVFETLACQDGGFEEVLSASLSLTNNINDGKFGLGSRTRFQAPEEGFDVSGSLTIEFDDGKQYKRFQERDFFTLELKAVATAEEDEIGNTGVWPQAYFFLPKCKYDGTTPVISDKSYIVHDMPFMGIYDDENDTPDLTVILVSDETQDVVF